MFKTTKFLEQKNNQFQNYFSFPSIEQNKKDMLFHLKNNDIEKIISYLDIYEIKKNDNSNLNQSNEENSNIHNNKDLN